jgi:hypothetical protein
MLLALHGERIELTRDRVQIAFEPIELRRRVVALGLERLCLLR